MVKSGISVRINKEVHAELVAHLISGDRKMGRFIDAAIREKIEKETKRKKAPNGKQKKSSI
jgi:hypothetical protein